MKGVFLVLLFVAVSAAQLLSPETSTTQTQTDTTTAAPTVESATIPTDVDADQYRQQAIQLSCQIENGTMPYWLDNTCKSYLSCINFNLSMDQCEEGSAFSFIQQACVPTDQVDCVAQNEEFSEIINAFLAPRFYQRLPQPFPAFAANNPASVDGQPGVETDQPVDVDIEGEAIDFDAMTIDLSDLPSITIDTTDALNITLAAETCERLGGDVTQLETSINTALLMLTGCPDRGCDVQLFQVECEIKNEQ